jgi:hypothetical protein
MSDYITHEQIKAACKPFDSDGRYAQSTVVVYHLSDGPPAYGVFGELPFYVHRRNIWGSITPEAKRLVDVYREQFCSIWGR